MVAACLGQVGYMASDDPDVRPAEAAIRQSLAINERVLGAEHPETGQSLLLLAGIQVTNRQDGDAIATYRRAIAVLEKAYGGDDPHVAQALIRLADVQGGRDQPGDFDAAVAAGQRSVAIWHDKAHDPKHEATSLALLASVYANHGQYRTAVSEFDRALALAEPLLGRSNPYVAWMIIGQRAHAQYGLGHYDAAIADFEEALRAKLFDESYANLRFGLAQSLWDARRERSRAVVLAQQAHDWWAAAGVRFKADIEASSRWLERHTVASR